jgi:anthranilate synthase
VRRALATVVGEPHTVGGVLRAHVPPASGVFAEEDRTRHAGVFATVRALVSALWGPEDALLGLYGAFGYDLIFQVEPLELRQQRQDGDRDLVLHLPDEILEFSPDHKQVVRHRYEFSVDAASTDGLPRHTESVDFLPSTPQRERDLQPGGYADLVSQAMPLFHSGGLFEVVPSQVFHRACVHPPAELFRRLRRRNPAPNSLLMNLGEGEYLVGASPEIFVRVQRDDDASLVVETSPISGTIARGEDALADAARIQELLNSVKDESELTMCTDVDRNDKARVCVPGTVKVTARRRIEMYSTLIHTVDQVRGRLRADRDALDAFLTHLWAVTVTGAPKRAAVNFIEHHENSPRRWYGGAVGRIGFDGCLDTVLTLRTIHIHDGVASVRAGATLLYDSSPYAEEAETELKAKALVHVLEDDPVPPVQPVRAPQPGVGLRVLLVDHQDSFVHCLADYLRQTGASVTTYRSGHHLDILAEQRPDLLVLSPGPGRPEDFNLAATLAYADEHDIPTLGVCLGLQGLVEYFGGDLNVMDTPVHGKSSRVRVISEETRLLEGLPSEFDVGRYHSLYASRKKFPDELRVTAVTDDEVVMAIEHRSRSFAAVQFHPESIMTFRGGVGHRLIANAVSDFSRRPPAIRR